MSQQEKPEKPLDNAQRQRQHVKRKQESHSRLQCWISLRHASRLAELGRRLEDSQASLIEQAIDLLYQHECQQEKTPEPEPRQSASEITHPRRALADTVTE
ncbi:RepB family protein [Aeromonas bivalvium]|uniref:Protein CopB n=1 Tax=Aeromonas bivalvium TaxID=440079 RepID=A0ABW9GK59_9GAMM|nr:RepB family protein [Aeromonas bivalvium]